MSNSKKYLPEKASWFRVPDYLKKILTKLGTVEQDIQDIKEDFDNLDIPEVAGFSGEVEVTGGKINITNGLITSFEEEV